MIRSWHNTLVAVLLTAVLAATCVFSCLVSTSSNAVTKATASATSAGSIDPHACCHRTHSSNKGQPSRPEVPSKDCQNSTLDIAKTILQLAPPALSSTVALAPVSMPSVFASRLSDHPAYSPPDLLALHQTFLI
jgi:hypothetical protein